MATKNIVPRSDKEGQLGTNAKQWNKVIAHTGSFQAVSSSLIPDSADTYDLGSSTKFWKDLYISSGSINFIDPSDNSVSSTISVSSDGTLNIGSAVVSGSSIPDADNTYDLGSSSKQWKDLYVNGTANIDTLTLTSGASVTSILDEDAMGSDSATALATQQSIKAYVDSQVTAQDLDATTDSGTIDIDLDSETLTIAGGEGIDTSATGTTITIAGEEASTSNKGVASFSSDNFAVSSGVVTIKDSGVANDELAGSIANAKLANSSITLTQGAGMGSLGAVSLGGSVTVGVDGVLEDLDTLGAASSDGEIIVATGAGAFAYESGATLRTSIGVDAAGTDNSTNVTLVTTSHDYLSISGQAITLGTIDIGDDTNLVGGDGLALSGDTLAVNVDDSSIEINSDTLRVKASGITNAMLGGSIANAKLANSTISGVSLGSNLNDLTVDDTTIELNSGTTYNGSAARTISGKTAAIANGGAALATADQIHTFVTTQTDSTAADTSGNAATATLASTVTVSDSTANTNFPVAFHNESNALLDDTGTFTYNPSTSTLVVPNINVSGTQTFVDTANLVVTSSIIFEGATADGYETTLTVVDPTADRTITLPNATDTVALLAATQTFTNKTLTSPDINTPDIDGGTIDGATIATSDITVGSSKTLNVSAGTLTTSTAQKVAIIGGGDTDDLSEGSSNLYYTDARVVTKIDSLAVVSGSATNVRSFLNVENGADVTDTSNVTSAGALMDSEVTNLSFVKGLTSGISNGNVLVANAAVSDNDFLKIDGTSVEGRTAAEVRSDLNVEDGADVTDTSNVTSAGALMDSELTSIADVKALDQSVISGASPTFGTANMTDASNKRFMTDAQETKLDSVESNATADQTDEEIQDIVGAMLTGNTETGITVTYQDGDGTIDFAVASQTDENFTSADHTKLDGIEASADVTDADNVTAAGALMDSECSSVSSLKAINQGLTTTSDVQFSTVTSEHSTTPQIILNDTGATSNRRLFRISGGGDKMFFEGRNNGNTGDGDAGQIMEMSMATGDIKIEESVGIGVAANGTTGRLDCSNDVVAFSSSDRRWKENIIRIENPLDKISKIGGYTFDWKELTEEEKQTQHGNSGHDVGVIAQEIQEVLPEVVKERDNGYLAVDYEKIVPLLIESIKELKQEVDDIKQKCDCLNK